METYIPLAQVLLLGPVLKNKNLIKNKKSLLKQGVKENSEYGRVLPSFALNIHQNICKLYVLFQLVHKE